MTRNPYANGIEDPEWLQNFHPDGAMSFGADAHGHPGVLTIHGLRDLAHHLKEEAAEEIREWMEEGERSEAMPEWLRAVLPAPIQPLPVLADINPAVSWSAQTIPVAAGVLVPLSFRGDRVRALVSNVGATNPVWISPITDTNNFDTTGASPISWIKIPIGSSFANPREIRSGGKIYAWSPVGTTVDIQEEFGYKYREGGFLSP